MHDPFTDAPVMCGYFLVDTIRLLVDKKKSNGTLWCQPDGGAVFSFDSTDPEPDLEWGRRQLQINSDIMKFRA
jgi:hypothetical protein